MPFILLVLFGIAFLRAGTVVTATDLTAGQVVFCAPGQPVTLVFTHSIYGGDVEETFLPRGDGQIVRVEMTTANAASADYYAYTASVVREDDRYRVEVPPAIYDEVIVRVGNVGRQRLRIAGEEIDLLAATGDGHRVKLDSARVGFLDRLTGRGC